MNLALRPKAVIGMVHVQALPGTPKARLTVDEIVEQAVAEARVLADAGFDALIVESMLLDQGGWPMGQSARPGSLPRCHRRREGCCK